MVAPVIFLPDSRLVLSQHGRLYVVNLETASRDAQTLTGNSIIPKNKLNTQGEKIETAKLRVFVLNISSPPSVKLVIYEIKLFFLVFRRLKNTAQDIHFVL